MLKKNGLAAKSGRTGKPRQPKPTEQQYIEENLIKNKFEITTPNYLWCSDITELKCNRSKVYVCGIIDVATRRIVGWSIAKNQTQKLVQDALKMAIGRNPNRPEGAVYHSDRGCQYTAKRTKQLVEENGFRKSMSRPGTPSDNQPIESFWKTLECEMADISHFTFEGFPKAFNRLVVTWSAWTRHTLSKTIFLHKLLCSFCCILTPSITVVNSSFGSVWISSDCHFQCILHQFLCLVLGYAPTNYSSCCYIYDPTDIHF